MADVEGCETFNNDGLNQLAMEYAGFSEFIWGKDSWIYSWFRWCPTSMSLFAKAERKVLKNIVTALRYRYVTIDGPDKRIWTAWSTNHADRTPLVLVHGMGGGIGLWCSNIDQLAEKRPLYVFDLIGFGRSSRPKFSYDAAEAERLFVDSIEKWREKMGLEKFILLGHSLGAYVASSYAIDHSDRVEHLILVDAWGFPERPPEDERYPLPLWARMAAAVFSPFNPLAVVRAAGPWGPGLVSRFRPDFRQKFSHITDSDQDIYDYIYHCNAQTPSGETAFKTMSVPFGWAKHPMVRRIIDVNPNIPITMIYGSRSWIDSNTGYYVRCLRHPSPVDVKLIRGAGHHVYADRADEFNRLVNEICDSEPGNEVDILPRTGNEVDGVSRTGNEVGDVIGNGASAAAHAPPRIQVSEHE